jgi:low affinity Fe/Cu permease
VDWQLSRFSFAALSIVAWAGCGPYFGFSADWQMVVNTGTTICTFLMVFVIQNSQNRDGLALQIKLDEIIRAMGGAKNSMIDLEDLSQHELDEKKVQFAKIALKARNKTVRWVSPRSRKALGRK